MAVVFLRLTGGTYQMAMGTDLKGVHVWDILTARNMMMNYIWDTGRKEESWLKPRFLFGKLDK